MWSDNNYWVRGENLHGEAYTYPECGCAIRAGVRLVVSMETGSVAANPGLGVVVGISLLQSRLTPSPLSYSATFSWSSTREGDEKGSACLTVSRATV